MQLKNKKFFLLDKDGTLSLSDKILEGTLDFITHLKENDIQFAVATNNSSKTANSHLENLNNMGLEFTKENIIVSLDVAIYFIRQKKINRLFWIANSDVSKELHSSFTFDNRNPEAILVTFDTELNYDKLLTLANLLHNNIPYYVTHSDIVCPTETYDIPDVGTFIKMMEMTTKRVPDISFGKPSKHYIDYIKNRYNVKESEMVIIGDRLYTDIKLAEGNDITSILVLSGETKLSNYTKSNIKADYVLDSIKKVINLIDIENKNDNN